MRVAALSLALALLLARSLAWADAPTLADCDASDYQRVLHPSSGPTEARAVWLDASLIKWPGTRGDGVYRIYQASRGGIVFHNGERVSGADRVATLVRANDVAAIAASPRFRYLGEGEMLRWSARSSPDGPVTKRSVLFQHLEQPFGNSLPKGVKMDGAASKTLLTGEETKGFITLKAADDAAPVEKQLIPVMAHISINFVMKHTLCGAPVFVTVEPK